MDDSIEKMRREWESDRGIRRCVCVCVCVLGVRKKRGSRNRRMTCTKENSGFSEHLRKWILQVEQCHVDFIRPQGNGLRVLTSSKGNGTTKVEKLRKKTSHPFIHSLQTSSEAISYFPFRIS
jgi:uridine kinase